ncbi:MAG: hypothetical protein K0S08_1039 [Gammaproteobacteria bacterium]|jgi:MHS family proline/betaine transporter-like MFS transporter|nr:hypothetical protein [Gammaproteobacteria bacterium]
MILTRRLLAGVIGSGLEWYDFAIYGSFANIIAALFFPHTNHFNAILATFGIFAVGFFMRPLGGFIFGHFGDQLGRSRVLIFTVYGMTCPTVLIGLLPTYQQAGVIAPLLLLLARVVQGLVIGGEYTGALLFLAENEIPQKRAQTSCLAMLSALGGVILGSVVVAVFTNLIGQDSLYRWGWRIPFLFGAVLGFVGYRLRHRMTETEIFLKLVEESRIVQSPASKVFRAHKRAMFLIIGVCVISGVGQYLMFTYFPSFIQHSANLSLDKVLQINTFGMLVIFFSVLFFAKLSDRLGRRPILIGASLGFLFLSIPIFYLLSQSSIILVILGVGLYGALVGIASAPMAALYMELFPTEVRYSGIAISYNISFALFAGTAPALAALLVKVFQTSLAPAYLLMFASLISLFCFWLMPETVGKDLKN